MKTIKCKVLAGNKTAEEEKFNQPYISLKFGSIKSADFKGSPEAMAIHNLLPYDHTKENNIETIKAYNGNFYFWWDNRWGTKDEAIEYIENYKSTNP